MAFRHSITKQDRKRKQLDGSVVVQTRYFVNYRDPKTNERKLPSFPTRKEAEAFRNKLVNEVESGTYSAERKSPTIKDAVENWLKIKEVNVRPRTLEGYKRACAHITGPFLTGSARDRFEHTCAGVKAEGSKLVAMLGSQRIAELTTGDIRVWHQLLSVEISAYSANRAKMVLESVLALAEEDFGVGTPKMPTMLSKGQQKAKKAILTLDQLKVLIAAAQADKDRGIYYAWPFLTGTRISEQLAMSWRDIDFERGVITVRRTIENDGSIVEITKTKAGMRDVPMSAPLRTMLLDWRIRCPRNANNDLDLVFPSLGMQQAWPLPRIGGGTVLWYQNYRRRIFASALKRLGLPHVTPHSARHLFISTLQAQGIEVGLVAKMVGHANAAVTLSHYTQAVRGGEEAIKALDRALAS
jgi:integrase